MFLFCYFISSLDIEQSIKQNYKPYGLCYCSSALLKTNFEDHWASVLVRVSLENCCLKAERKQNQHRQPSFLVGFFGVCASDM